MRVGIVANEPSGDLLGASLVRALKGLVPEAEFVGVAGPHMQAAGVVSLLPMERLSVMGLTEVVKHLPELLGHRRALARHFLANRPDVFIGVDAPDFNLGLETRLRRAGILTVHLVSPTVWAWRPGRVKAIRRAVDLMLGIFPFEEAYLREQGVPVRYIGHPLADEIPWDMDQGSARAALGLSAEGPVIALLPGSRVSEVTLLAEPFLATARWCLERRPGLVFVAPMVNATLRGLFADAVARHTPGLPLTLLDGRSREVIAASDVVLTASGTATLETLLIGRPMVVGYRVSGLTYRLVKALDLVKVPHIAMANLLVGRALAPEFIQERCRAGLLGPALLRFLEAPEEIGAIRAAYREVHGTLRRDAGRQAAEAVLALVRSRAGASPDRAG